MNPTRMIRRSAVILTWLPCALLASVAAAPVALAARAPHHAARARVAWPPVLPAGWYKHPSPTLPAHTAVAGGMPGQQITLIATGAALLTAALVVLLAQAGAARRRAAASPA